MVEIPGFLTGNLATGAFTAPWDTPMEHDDELMRCAEEARLSPLPSPDAPYFRVWIWMRESSQPGDATTQQLIARIAPAAQRFNDYVNAGFPGPEGTRPTGVGMFLLPVVFGTLQGC